MRKSRTHRRSEDEFLELQPLHTSSGCESTTTPKGQLKRMQRVKSHDLSQEESVSALHDQHSNSGEPMTSPLGAGLPLLSRLR